MLFSFKIFEISNHQQQLNTFKAFLRNYGFAIGSSVAILLITLFAYMETERRAYIRAQNVFELKTEEAKNIIEYRIQDYIQILRSTNAFVASSDTVTRKDWGNFVNNLNLEKNYPGIQALAYSMIIPKNKLQSHIEQIRQEGFPGYMIKPTGDRDIYTSIIYIQPFEGRNLRAFGYDMFSEPTRKKAMELARDSGQPAISGKVKLVQETEENIQPGLLLFYPVYQQNQEPITIEERRKSIRGYIYNPFRTYDLMHSIINKNFHKIDIEIYDQVISEKTLLFNRDSVLDTKKTKDPERHYGLKELKIGGRVWKIYFSSSHDYMGGNAQGDAFLVIGIILSMITFFITSAFSKVRRTRISNEIKSKENAELLEKIFLAVPAIVAIVKATDQSFLLINPQCQRLFGNRAVLNKPFREALPELEGQGFFESLEEVIETGKPYVGKEKPAKIQPNLNGPANTLHFNFIYQPLFNDKKEIEAVLMFAIEVTEQVAARQQLRLMNKKLHQKNIELKKINNDLDNFVYTASHDLKAPISNIEGLMIALEDIFVECSETSEASELLKMIDQSIQRFKLTIGDLTDITKIQKNIAEDIEDVYLEEIVEEVKHNIRTMIDESKAIIRFTCYTQKFKFSKANLRSIVYNLLSNAIKYRSPDRDLVIEISCKEDSNYILLEVTDNGLGINENQKEKIFGMFKRYHTHVEGTGIGLYIVKRIIENYGGKILLESEEGVGSTFKVYIPLDFAV